jgi:GT2 family glycosyltransferase
VHGAASRGVSQPSAPSRHVAVRHTARIDEPTPSASLPTVALVIPSFDGAHYLESCLDSVAALDYPRERLETIVVDNGSTDGTRELLADRYPWARVLPQARNTGFAAAVNTGARASTADCLALANNDMRLDPEWLRKLVAAYDPAAEVRCVAALILDAQGELIDFADGYLSFYGMGGQAGFGRRLDETPIDDGRELLFACGGSMLVDRALFLELGGFDESFFAYFEDVDFGWRLRLAGYRVLFAAGARAFHHHHGSANVFTQTQRLVLYERNALLTLTKNLDDGNLYPVLAAALCLTSGRALADSGTDPSAHKVGGTAPPERETVPANAISRLHAISQFVGLLDHALAERARVQALRTRTDAELFELFRRPFWTPYREEGYLEAAGRIVRAFGIDERFPKRRAARLLLVGAGDATTADLALAAAGLVYVVVAASAPMDLSGVETLVVAPGELEPLVRECDVVLVEAGAPLAAEALQAADGVRPVALHDGGGGLPEQLRDLIEEPWRFGLDTSAAAAVPATTEELQVLASVRREIRAGSPPLGRGQAVWAHVPEAARARLRPLLRRLQSRFGG